jgi:hypothetical protein
LFRLSGLIETTFDLRLYSRNTCFSLRHQARTTPSQVGQAGITARFEGIRDVGFFLFVVGWIVVVFVNRGIIITDSLGIILGADALTARLLALNLERANYAN